MPRKIPSLRTRATQPVPHMRTHDIRNHYDADWKRLRLSYLMEHPLCQCDDCKEGKLRLTRAEVVDHRIPITTRPELRLEWSNLRSMSKRCHDKHTRTEENRKRGASRT
jgi:5-methylcytosine-specific restriction endonuclease McrA